MSSLSLPITQVTQRAGLVQSLAHDIATIIAEEQLTPGSRLPNGKTLAARYGVAVPTLREALRRLEAMGVIEIRHGAGVYVRTVRPRMLIANPGLGEIDGRVALDVLDARLLVEPHLAELAARMATDEALADLSGILDQAMNHLDGDIRILMRLNRAFHSGIAECSGNLVLTHVMESLVDLYSPEQATILSIYDTHVSHNDNRANKIQSNVPLRDHEEHQAILEAIASRDPGRARSLMERHIIGVKEVIVDRLSALSPARGVGNSDLGTPERDGETSPIGFVQGGVQ